jgi:hypothetical protein
VRNKIADRLTKTTCETCAHHAFYHSHEGCELCLGWVREGYGDRACELTREQVLAIEIEKIISERLRFAASEIERELICCEGETCDEMGHEICRWGMAGRLIVLDVAMGERVGDA